MEDINLALSLYLSLSPSLSLLIPITVRGKTTHWETAARADAASTQEQTPQRLAEGRAAGK